MTDRPIRPPEVERLRQPHPQQAEIDATSAAMLVSDSARRRTRLVRARIAELHGDHEQAEIERKAADSFAGTDEPDDFEAAQDYVDGGGEDFAFD